MNQEYDEDGIIDPEQALRTADGCEREAKMLETIDKMKREARRNRNGFVKYGSTERLLPDEDEKPDYRMFRVR